MLCVQGWHPTAAGPGEWLVSFQGLTGIRLSLPTSGAADSLVSGALEVLPASTPGAATTYGVGKEVLSAMGECRVSLLVASPNQLVAQSSPHKLFAI